MSPEAKSILDSGVIYQTGRDENYKPLVILALSRVPQLKDNEDYILEALNHFLVMVREKMLLPHYVERWNLLIDTNDMGVVKSIEEFLTTLYEDIRTHFAQSLDRIYLMNVHLMQQSILETWNRK